MQSVMARRGSLAMAARPAPKPPYSGVQPAPTPVAHATDSHEIGLCVTALCVTVVYWVGSGIRDAGRCWKPGLLVPDRDV